MLPAQDVEELKSIHSLPSLLLYENGVLIHIVEGKRECICSPAACKGYLLHALLSYLWWLSTLDTVGLPQKRPGRKLASAIRQYLLHERDPEEQQSEQRPASAGKDRRSA